MRTSRARFAANCILIVGILHVTATAATAQDQRQIDNPPDFLLTPGLQSMMLAPSFGAPQTAQVPLEVSLKMDIVYADRQIWNPNKQPGGGYDDVRMRVYQDASAAAPPPPDAPLVGPTISIRPGQTLRVALNNRLPADETCISHDDPNVPHCFNGTNLHTHGLWVNPSGNGDNVLLSIRPGVSFEYEYAIPPDHPAGTFWYHSHLHGSTALQVSSGMAGAIVIRGDRLPTADRNGDIDTLLRLPDGSAIPERVMVLQQIQYACRDANDQIEYVDGDKEAGVYLCNPGQVGGIEGYDQFGPGTWPKSGRYTSINGRVLGSFAPGQAGVPERWRLVHAGVRDTINLEIRPWIGTASGGAPDITGDGTWLDRNCGAPIPYLVVAQDGLTMSIGQFREQAVLQPGYRVDALVMLPEAGEYCVVDADAPAASNVNADTPQRRLLGLVRATAATDGSTTEADIETRLTDWLVAAAERTMPGDVRADVVAGLREGTSLARFVPHPDVADDEVTGTQTLVFNIDFSGGAPVFQVDGSPYDPTRVDRTLMLGGVDEWTMRSAFVSHPFHIHVNPFQIVEIRAPDGTDVSAPGAIDNPDGSGADMQYPGLKGVWKDTLWIKSLINSRDQEPDPAVNQYTIVVRTRYQRYIGEFVLHCHILDHEDQGMMQNVMIALPDGTGGIAPSHH